MRVAIYARVSTKDKGQSVNNQLTNLRAYALAHGYTVYKEYTKEESGGTADREAAHKRRFDLVLFWSLDRFSREGALPTLQHLNLLESYGVSCKSYTKQYLDSTGIFKEAVMSMLVIVAKQERERTRAGLVRAKSKGKPLDKPNKSQSDIKQIRRLKGGGMSNYAIGKGLKMSASTVAKYIND